MHRSSTNVHAGAVSELDDFAPPPADNCGVPAGRMLSLADVAELVDVSIATVRRRVAEGALRVHRIGRAVRVSQHDFEAFLAASRGEDA